MVNNYTAYWLRELETLKDAIGEYESEYNLLSYYYNLYLTRFKYENIPDSIKTSMYDLSNMDRWLWYNPAVVFFKEGIAGVQCLPVVADADFNAQFFPTSWTAIGANGRRYPELTAENSVLVFNDSARSMPLIYVLKYVRKILKLEKTADYNIDFQKNPYIIEGDEDQKKSIEKFFDAVDDFRKKIIVRGGGKGKTLSEGIKVNALKVDYEADKYLSTIDKYENKILTYLGYNSVQIEKAERLITSEADSNTEKTRAQFTSAFNARKTALDRVNEMFKTDIKITPNELTRLTDVNGDGVIDDNDEKGDNNEL